MVREACPWTWRDGRLALEIELPPHAVASLTVLNRRNELRAHLHAALNVGATRQEVAEVVFQQVTYGGMPVVVEALAAFKEVLEERGEWE